MRKKVQLGESINYRCVIRIIWRQSINLVINTHSVDLIIEKIVSTLLMPTTSAASINQLQLVIL